MNKKRKTFASHHKSLSLIKSTKIMTSLMTKSSLYDMVSMIIPGFLFILCVEFASGVGVDNNFDNVAIGIVVFVLSYIVGLLLHLISKRIFDSIIRNDYHDISTAHSDINNTIKKEKNIRDYYCKYYKLMPEYTNEVIPVLESQVAFLKSMLIVIPVAIMAVSVSPLKIFDFGLCVSVLFVLYCICMFVICIWHFGLKEKTYSNVSWKILGNIVLFALPLVLFVFCNKDWHISNLVAAFILLLLEFLIYNIMRIKQKEIYKRIFEDDYYILLTKYLR